MDQNLRLTCKYKLKGIYNDLKKYSLNMIKFYGTSIVVLLGVLAIKVFYSKKAITIENINLYINYILPLGIILIIAFYMFSSFTLVIFSKPNIFYLIRDRNLFIKIAWIKIK